MKNFDLDGTLRKTGFIYDLFERNCQHYARHLLYNLLARNWSDARRESLQWDAEAWEMIPHRRYSEPRKKEYQLIKKGAKTAMSVALIWVLHSVI